MSVIRSWFERIALKKRSIHLSIGIFRIFLPVFPFLCPRKNRPRRSMLSRPFLKSDGSNCSPLPPVALYKRAIESDLLPSLMTKERQEKLALFHELFRAHKTSDSHKKPLSEFTTLVSISSDSLTCVSTQLFLWNTFFTMLLKRGKSRAVSCVHAVSHIL